MGFLSTLLEFIGFFLGLPLGLIVGHFLFIYFNPRNVKDPIIKPLCELDTETLRSLLPDIPLWVKNPDYDRVDWLNKVIIEMWPYLDKAICKMIESTTKPIFSQYIGKFLIESIEYEHLTLGSLPPTISGIKFYETQEKQIILQTGVRWASDANIVVAVKCFFVKIVLQLTDLQIFMVPRITFKPLVPTFPCFASISLSLIDKPHVDFGLRLFGGDIMAIPGLYQFVQENIKTLLSSLYHWPEALEVPVLDMSSGAMNKPVGILHVKVIRAVNLQKMDFLGKSDPYVKLCLSGERIPAKTTVQMSNLNPVWNEQFKLIVKDPQTQVLELHVFDWEKVKAHDKLGVQVIPLNSLPASDTQEFTLPLLKNLNPNDAQNRRNRGKIVVQLRFAPFREEIHGSSSSLNGDETSASMNGFPLISSGGVLSLKVERAEDVEGKHHTNPCAVVLLRGEQRKTKRIKKCRDPRWNEEFHFMLEEPPLDQKIYIGVISKRRIIFLSKESLGHVEINLTDVVNNGRINDRYHLINSRNGVIHVEIRWSST